MKEIKIDIYKRKYKFILGLILSTLSLYILNNNKLFKMNKLSNICFILANLLLLITFFIFYILNQII